MGYRIVDRKLHPHVVVHLSDLIVSVVVIVVVSVNQVQHREGHTNHNSHKQIAAKSAL